MSITIGVDVSKVKLDIFYKGHSVSIKNEEALIRKNFAGYDRECRIVMEATGKYHR